MKLTNNKILLGIILLLLTLTSCKKIVVIDKSDANKYLDEYYLYLSDKKQDYVGIDLRSFNEEYVVGHLKGFVSYSLHENDKNSNSFQDWMMQNYDQNTTIFLIDSDGLFSYQEAKILKENGYKKIYVYNGGYDSLIKYNDGKIPIITGSDDCGC